RLIEEKTREAAGACGARGGALESLPTPAEVQRVVEMACPVGARSKVCTECLATQELYWVEEDIGCCNTFQAPGGERSITSMREARTMILEWRLTGPLDLSESRDWMYQTAARHQTLGLLPERLGQLSLSNEGLNRKLCHACVCWSILDRIHN
ncbi:hypothetical protein E2320_002247, partial [Naja naja]